MFEPFKFYCIQKNYVTLGHLDNIYIVAKIETVLFFNAVMSPKDADGIANGIDQEHSDLDLYYLFRPNWFIS